MLKSKKIQAGLYAIECDGNLFQVEDLGRHGDASCPSGWMLYGVRDGVLTYIDDFATKRQELQKIVELMA